MSLIELKKIVKIYNSGKKNQFQALKDINLNVDKGEMISIKGSSGAGKSTLLHILGLLDVASSGKYYIDGIDASNMSLSEKAMFRNKKLGFVLQDFGLVEQQTVFDSVIMPLIFSESKNINYRKCGLNALDSVGMGMFADKMVNELSGGEKQRVAIARALINSPEIILCDEPTGSLDEENAMRIMDILKEQNSKGITVIIVTHDSEIASLCEKTYIMRYGELFDMPLH